MSMRYYACEDYGFVLSKDVMKIICEKEFVDDPVEDECYGDALYESDICNCLGNFTGEAFYVTDDGNDSWSHSQDYDDDCVYYIPVNKYPTLFKTAYTDMNELVEEFKEQLGDYLPDDFDYRANIRHIVGTTFG